MSAQTPSAGETDNFALAAFQFLLSQHGFKYVQLPPSTIDVAARFDSETTRVTVSYELGSQPWVTLGRLESVAGSIVEAEAYALEFVRQIRKAESPRTVVPVEPASAALERRLEEEAASLRSCALDIVLGDFSIFPQLRELRDANRRRREGELHGES